MMPSGDDGVGPDGICVSNDGKNNPKFLPEFPASCPCVTTVRGTRLFEPEIAASSNVNQGGFSSGGGFSNYFARPNYQNDVVSAYIKRLGGEHNGLFNTSTNSKHRNLRTTLTTRSRTSLSRYRCSECELCQCV